VANGRRTLGAVTMRHAYGDARATGRELKDQGIVVGTSETLLSDIGQLALDEASAQVLEASRSEQVRSVIAGARDGSKGEKEFLVDLVSFPGGVPEDHPLLRVALDQKLLEIVSTYLGLWPRLHSLSAWLNFPTDAPAALSQLWHRDPEDLRLIKVFIYLTSVDEQSGPFTYVPGTHPFGAVTASKHEKALSKRLDDGRMARRFPPESWRVCTGPPNTMILADTVGFHRGGKPTAGHRILITFTYTSGSPITKRRLRVRTTPGWASSAIQRFAAASSVESPPPEPTKARGSRE